MFPPDKAEEIAQMEGIKTFTRIIEERVFLDYQSKNHTAFLKGVDENYRQVTQIDSAIINGAWFSHSEPQVVVGNNISRLLNLGIFNYTSLLQILVPKPGKGQPTNPSDAFNRRQVIVSGIYSVNEELDDKYVFSSIGFARNLLNLEENSISAIEVKLAPNAQIDEVKEDLNAVFGGAVLIKDRAQLNDVLYKMLNTENLAVYLIFTLVLIIALFNVVGSIIMVILDKRENIITLFSLGATPDQIKNIFFMQGLLMTVIGGTTGLLFSLILVYLQLQYDLVMITPSLPYPVAITLQNAFVVIVTILALGIMASYIAAGRSKKALTG